MLAAARKRFNWHKRKHCFELFGLDFILDRDYNVFLIEANTNPCLEESSGLLRSLLPRMIDDLLKLTVDRIFPMSHQEYIFGRQTKPGIVSHSPDSDPLLSANKISHSPKSKLRIEKNHPSIYSVHGYADKMNLW